MINKRLDFPILRDTVYLDSGAGVLKPIQVVNAMNDFYLKYPINPHNIDSKLGMLVHEKVQHTRDLVAKLINCQDDEIIFTSGTTDSINKFVKSYEPYIGRYDEILLSPFNHSSNIVPWIELANRTGAKIIYSDDLIGAMTYKTKIVAYAQMNNTVNKEVDVKALYEKALEFDTIIVNDAAQAIVHTKVDMDYCDVVAFSGNKLFGPTGIGVLAVKSKLLKKLKPKDFGGGATSTIEQCEWKPSGDFISNFEPGTINTAGIIGLGAAIEYLNSLVQFENHEKEVAEYAFDELTKIPKIIMHSKRGDVNIIFNVKDTHPQDVVSYLGARDIIMRAGMHCAQMVRSTGLYESSIRLSIAFYNNKDDIDKAIKVLKSSEDYLDI